MEARKFYVGEKIVGNALANRYGITSQGWRGIVTKLLPDGMIKVRGIKDSYNIFNVLEKCFDSLDPKEPKRNAEGKIICEHCGEVIEDESTLIWVFGKAICGECAEKHYETCSICGEVHLKTDMEIVDGETICEECYNDFDKVYKCGECGGVHMRRYENYVPTGYGFLLCNNCKAKGEYKRCDDCGRWFHKEDITKSTRDGHWRCVDCERYFKAKAIKEYGFKPDPIYKVHNHPDFESDMKIKELLFGVELEVDKGENKEDCANELLDASPDIYCKRDGSLSNGIEIVTHPCTLEYHKNDLCWNTLSEIALRYGFHSQDARTCGLHVHVGRRQMGKNIEERKATAAKIVLLADRHWNSLVKFSRRKPEQLNRWAKRPEVAYDEVQDGEETLISAALSTRRDGRYQAINLENDNTVEFRLFNGTLKVDTIIATLELVSNIVKYAKEKTPEECMESSWEDLTRGDIISNAENDKLKKYLEARELVEGETPTQYDWKIIVTEKFKVGDKVVVINSRGDGVSKLAAHIGEMATISYIHVGAGRHDFEYDIDFGAKGYGLHSCNGRLPNGTGYMVYAKNLKRYEEE